MRARARSGPPRAGGGRHRRSGCAPYPLLISRRRVRAMPDAACTSSPQLRPEPCTPRPEALHVHPLASSHHLQEEAAMGGFKRILAIAIVFGMASVSWLVLGAVTSSRSSQQGAALDGAVQDLWG